MTAPATPGPRPRQRGSKAAGNTANPEVDQPPGRRSGLRPKLPVESGKIQTATMIHDGGTFDNRNEPDRSLPNGSRG